MAIHLSSASSEHLAIHLSSGRQQHWGEEIPLAPLSARAVTLDLTEADLATPLSAARLAAAVSMYTAEGAEVQVTPPLAPAAAESLVRSGASMHLPEDCQLALPAPSRVAHGDALVPVTCLCRIADVEPLIERLERAMRVSLHGPLAECADAVLLSLSELCDNAISHGHSAHGVFVAAQHEGDARLTLAIGDLGVGIPGHLAAALPNLTDDDRVLCAAVKSGTTGVEHPPSPRGAGLAHALEELQGSSAARSELKIWSGTGRLRALFESGQSPKIAAHNMNSYTAGTWVDIDLQARPSISAPMALA
jgi:hypothetical protein